MKYIVLLRGINISGKNKVPMNDLKKYLENLGYTNVKTLLNSGNVILETNQSKDKVEKSISNMLKENFNFDIPICIIEASHLKDIMEHIPTWQQEENKDRYNNIIFTIPPTTIEDVCTKVGEPTENIDIIEPYKDIIYWSFDLKNYRKSSWWIKTASTDINTKITIRTVNTMKKLFNLVDSNN